MGRENYMMPIFRGIDLGEKIKAYCLVTLALSILLPALNFYFAAEQRNYTNLLIGFAAVYHICWLIRLYNEDHIKRIGFTQAWAVSLICISVLIPVVGNAHSVVAANVGNIPNLAKASFGFVGLATFTPILIVLGVSRILRRR